MPSKNRSWNTGFIVVAILFVSVLGWREWTLLPDGKTHLYFLDIGQGDSALIVTPSGKKIVVDGGADLRPLEQVGKYLSFFDRTIDLLVLSHPHLDHLFSSPEFLLRYRVRSVTLTGIEADLPRYHKLLSLVAAQRIPVLNPTQTGVIDLGDGTRLQLLWPTREALGLKWGDLNGTSVVMKVSDGKNSALFTGDMDERAEDLMLASGINVDADILKVAHHGSDTSSSTGFILAVSPTLAVISVGKINSYGHPRPEIIRRYERLGIAVKRTDIDGTIEIVWDR